MERLQEALSRARQRREEAVATGAPVKAPAQKPAAKTPVARSHDAVAEAWARLPTYEVNETVLRNNRVVSFFGGSAATPFDLLRTKILHLAKSNGWHRIAITSPTPKCGKTTVTANLCFSLSKQEDLRVLAFDADMRRPNLGRVLGIHNQTFARVLTGHEAAQDNLVRYGGNVAFSTNKTPTPNPSEILQSQKASSVMAEIEQTYAPDLVLFDTPPLLTGDDTLGLLEYVDAALLVAAAEVTSIGQVDVAEKEIAQRTEVVGVVLNQSRYAAPGYQKDYEYY